LAVTFVRPNGDPASDERATEAIHHGDPEAIVTGYGQLEDELRSSLRRDLPRVGLVALGLVGLGLRAALGSLGQVAIALSGLGAEVAVLGLSMRLLGVSWHIYDALVVPVLLGITIDEAMFLLHAAREKGTDEAFRTLGPRIVATALTTAGGFSALLV